MVTLSYRGRPGGSTWEMHMFKESDIRPVDLMKLKEPLLEADKAFLRERKDRFVNVRCPACDSEEREIWAEKEGFEYDRCMGCQTIYMNPRADQSLMDEFYHQSKNYYFWNQFIFPQTNEQRKINIYRPRAERIINLVRQKGAGHETVLEVGAGFGTFCEALRETEFFARVIAVEPTPSLAETCREKGFETYATTIEEFDIDAAIDVIVCFEVIEHLFSPAKMLEKVSRLLKPGGLLIGSCPSGQCLGSIVLKERFRSVDHEHVNLFNIQSLASLFERYGFEVVDLSTPGELDVDIMKNQMQEEGLTGDRFVEYILSSSQGTQSLFQDFLKKAGLSSHLWFAVRKIDAY